ncbi:MAG: hypothetical protein HYZ65_08800 [Burkholderiales bacterium]|nr:hypothetical protein [Burkholderiales bacterium]
MSSYQYVTGTVRVTNALPGQKISVVLSGSDITWSSGDPLSRGTGISLSSDGGVAVPVSMFSVNGSTISVNTVSGGSTSTLSFTVNTSLATAVSPQFLSICSDSDPGVQVTFQFPGQQQVILSQTPIGIPWPQ